MRDVRFETPLAPCRVAVALVGLTLACVAALVQLNSAAVEDLAEIAQATAKTGAASQPTGALLLTISRSAASPGLLETACPQPRPSTQSSVSRISPSPWSFRPTTKSSAFRQRWTQ